MLGYSVITSLYGDLLIALLTFIPAFAALFFSLFPFGVRELRNDYQLKLNELHTHIKDQLEKNR